MGVVEEEIKLLDLVHLNDFSGKWVLAILLFIYFYSGTNFYSLKKRIAVISPKVLSQKLKFLEDAGLVIKKIVVEQPKRVEFYLTKEGTDLAQAFLKVMRLRHA